ncbi:response regulator [Pedobacter montanisoli]|uniref:Response regulator n=1 Tax=Pedobacter montanisoli TaxID=2923277 RepID=A0ABS9ZTB9_9SPHI|nr:response regulator [Pedobacter montanisoli]MCJ0741844.1 response regulator [Pedobacter montanisoli]
MKLKYNILWIENEHEWLDPALEFVSDLIEEHGFEPVPTVRSKEEEVLGLLAEEKPFKDFDLILVDLQLDKGDRGSNIIKNIRDHKIFTDVIFYSQDTEGIRQIVKDQWLDGVYCSSRNRADFEDKFERVFLTTIKKIQHISSMRGLVLSETSQLDVLLVDIIGLFFKNRETEEITSLKKYIVKDLILSSAKDNLKRAENITNNIASEDLLNHKLFDSYKKMRAVGKIIEKLKNENLVSKDLFLREYTEEVIEMRNDLAHVKEENEGGRSILKCIKGTREFNDEECVIMRKNLKKHYQQLNSILSTL